MTAPPPAPPAAGAKPGFILRIKRADSPFFRALNRLAKTLLYGSLPVPRVFLPLFRLLYNACHVVPYAGRRLLNFLFIAPMFRSRCERVGANLSTWWLPDVRGQVKIYIGDNFTSSGHLGITSGRVFDETRLVVGDNTGFSHNVQFTINKEITVGSHVLIASNCVLADTDSHPLDAQARARHEPPRPKDIKPIHIGDYVWIGANCHILKGVTIGEGAIVSANSVVTADVPPYTIVRGNPAVVVSQRKPAAAAGDPPPEAVAES